jgi:DNA-binding CsgD family transcriptional regulator
MESGYALLTQHLDCKDILGLWATDPDLSGVNISVPSKSRVELGSKERLRFQQLTVHITAGSRLLLASKVSSPDLPGYDEILLNPKRFTVEEADDGIKDTPLLELVRDAAVRVDKARGKLRRSDPDEALALWQGLVHGRWSLIDWFDTDGRRFVLAKPNAPNLGDPRGLSGREHQVVTYAAQGEAVKLVAYRLGLSQNRVSSLLQSAMRKLGVKTHPQLVERMRAMPPVKRGPGPNSDGEPGDPTDFDSLSPSGSG